MHLTDEEKRILDGKITHNVGEEMVGKRVSFLCSSNSVISRAGDNGSAFLWENCFISILVSDKGTRITAFNDDSNVGTSLFLKRS